MSERRRTRSVAFKKLASLSVASTSTESSDFVKLCDNAPRRSPSNHVNGIGAISVARAPISIRELDVLLALCNAAPLIEKSSNAQQLLDQLLSYSSECCYQSIEPSPFLRELDPSPWETLSFSLFNAILRIGTSHQSLQRQATEAIYLYLENCSKLVSYFAKSQQSEAYGRAGSHLDEGNNEPLVGIFTLTTSLLGFLRASSLSPGFWDSSEIYELVKNVKNILSERLFITVEAYFSAIRNSTASNNQIRETKQYLRGYAAAGRPLGEMLLRKSFMHFIRACASLLVVPPSSNTEEKEEFDVPLWNRSNVQPIDGIRDDLLCELLANTAAAEIVNLEEVSDYISLGSAWHQQMAHSVKASSLVTFLCCSLSNDEIADSDVLMAWLESTLTDPVQLTDKSLVSAVLKSMAAMASTSSTTAATLSRSLPRFLSNSNLPTEMASVAAQCLLHILKALSSQDTVITTLYGLGNSLSSSSNNPEHLGPFVHDDINTEDNQITMNGNIHHRDSSVDLTGENSEQPSNVHNTIILTIVTVARGFKDEKITALALSMLIQKVGKVNLPVDLKIITEAAKLAAEGTAPEFRALLRLYMRLSQEGLAKNNVATVHAVSEARGHLSTYLKGGSLLYEIYLQHLLEAIISKGDAPQTQHYHRRMSHNFEYSPHEIALLLGPLASLVANNISTVGIEDIEDFPALQRDAWYNLVIHGFSLKSSIGQKHLDELKILARYSQGLISEERADRLETDVELNTVLRRGAHSPGFGEHRKEMIDLLPQCESDIKSLSYPELMLLETAYFVETLRAFSGDCTTIVTYFVDPALRRSALGNCMVAVARSVVDTFLANTLNGGNETFSAPFAAQQLSLMLQLCCHRVERVQQVAYQCADRLISQVPPALCQKRPVFALLDLLSILWASCLEGETDEYEWRSEYASPQGTTKAQLSDDFNFRRQTLRKFHAHAKQWIAKAINIAPLDIKGLLQTYLSDYGDDDAFGHMSMGRSFAFEMGAMVPLTDQRLGAIETEADLNINTASDFMAQYTSRQEYRYADPSRAFDPEAVEPLVIRNDGIDTPPATVDYGPNDQQSEIVNSLARIESRMQTKGDAGPPQEFRDSLRRAAALLCRTSRDESTVISCFVRIPFSIFSKQSIKLGLSLWMGVIKENPRLESRILLEIFEGWIRTAHAKLGIFSDRSKPHDPFFLKEEFAPSDRDTISHQRQKVHDLIAPHFRILQFLSSHYTATRISSLSIEKAYHRFLRETFYHLRSSTNHPLARETYFHIVLLGLRVLKHSVSLTNLAQWRLKDDILTAALAWFRNPPRWSFGGNRLQVKAETHLLADVDVALQNIANIGANGTLSMKSLRLKQNLLQLLLKNEQTRLMVWLFPLDHSRTHHFTSGQQDRHSVQTVSHLLATAWDEGAGVATQLASRFQSEDLVDGIRQLILQDPIKAVDEPYALNILLGPSLPDDVLFQLKYLLYWKPVNPITAVTYFLPGYGNHPFIIQYAVKSLESHSVDVTFFYVPQIVQALRYDVLGYVERYIIETAKFSQLFAHQIIWNMKANAYKDEESQDPDPVKPTLDKVTVSLIDSFSSADKAFYEREFSFFNEVTSISGKLRPFIKKSKPEKKQKIEEELRKIQVDPGVYLPSNPSGVVVGIDRKSGKPLQSHAKAPFMATFRIKKEQAEEIEETAGDQRSLTKGGNGENPRRPASEFWQSAIFKVGDDCRQDVLALQLIAAFRGIFHYVGLPVYVFPYRVTATAPGCGVIDVLPSSISRDMLGREAVNGLYEWFKSKFGGEDAPAFQVARANLVKSLAAYSVITYLLQFKDRHNGNIMFDEQGHVLHVDFGFCFDIAPGGVTFERAPFKLTREMVAVMGGRETQSFRWFEELCVKAFLASRQYVTPLSHIIIAMLDSGLPCFTPQTIQNFKDRFALEKTESEAAEFMLGLVRKSYNSIYSRTYDEFQLWTNGIPY